ncbi:putative T7SS-secreted protein [Streptomyces globisporus]
MRKVDSSGWAGEGGDAFRKKFGVHPAKWAQAADAKDREASRHAVDCTSEQPGRH